MIFYNHKKELEKLSIQFTFRKCLFIAIVKLHIFDLIRGGNASAAYKINRLLLDCEVLKAQFKLKELKKAKL